MKFISVRRLAVVFMLEFSPNDDTFIQKLRESVEEYFIQNSVLKAFGQGFTQKQLDFILLQLEEENALVFHNWIENDHLLVGYLFSKGEIILPSKEINLHEESELLSSYQNFLDIYLAPILNERIKLYIHQGDLIELTNHLKFSPLLPKKRQIELQKPVNGYLNQLLAQTKVSQSEELFEQLKSIYSNEYVEVLNGLDNHFYSDVLDYINTAKLTVQRNDLSPLLLDRIKTAIMGLDLKEEDQNKALTFINAKSFHSRSENPRSRLNHTLNSPFFIIAVVLLVINFLFIYKCEHEVLEVEEVGSILIK